MNAFESVVLKLELPENRSNHWARAVVASWRANKHRLTLPHYQSQILEDSVFEDLAVDFGLAADDLRALNYQGSAEIQDLKRLMAQTPGLRPAQRVALSCILSSISRFKLADQILRSVDIMALDPREQIHALLQRFKLDNRMGARGDHEPVFREIFSTIEQARLMGWTLPFRNGFDEP